MKWKLDSCPFRVKNKKSGAMTFLLPKGKNQAFISSSSEGSIGSCYIFTGPHKWPITRANSLLPSPDSDYTGKHLSKSVIIGQMPKKSSKMSDSVIEHSTGNQKVLGLIPS